MKPWRPTEIDQLHPGVGGEENVLSLDVPMEDVGTMEVAEPLEHVPQDVGHQVLREGLSLLLHVLHQVCHRASVTVLDVGKEVRRGCVRG